MPAILPWTPKVSYGTAPTVLLFQFAPVPWEPPKSRGIGSSGEAASGAIEAFEIRRDQLVRMTLRFFESEWPAVESWLAWAQKNASAFDFYFDQDDPATLRNVYLDAPALGKGDLEPDRQTSFLGLFTFPVTLRTVDGSKFDVNWSGV